MLVDIVLPGWAPFYGINLSEDVPGYMAAPATALSYPWTHLIAGHLGRLGTRDDVTVHQQYIADIEAGARTALANADPTRTWRSTATTSGPRSRASWTRWPMRPARARRL